MEALFNHENKEVGLINLWNFHYFLTVECKYVQLKLTSWLFCWYLYCFRAKLYRLEHIIVSLLLDRQRVVKYLHWYFWMKFLYLLGIWGFSAMWSIPTIWLLEIMKIYKCLNVHDVINCIFIFLFIISWRSLLLHM